MSSLVAFLVGVVFALGLGVSGMTQPGKVLAFLDLGGRWDPSLALVMLGAIGVHAPLARLILRRRAPVVAPEFSLPAPGTVDARLLVGAALFGVGWGLAGLCPGPAVTALASGKGMAIVFATAMVAGMGLERALMRSPGRQRGAPHRTVVGVRDGDERVGPAAVTQDGGSFHSTWRRGSVRE